jgi:hypothetical protein
MSTRIQISITETDETHQESKEVSLDKVTRRFPTQELFLGWAKEVFRQANIGHREGVEE